MSVEAMTWTFKYSPYTLGTRLVHLAVADWANEGHGWELWASQSTIAAKAKVSVPTVSAALKRMVNDGYLEELGRDNRGQARYRFLTPQISEGSQKDESDPQDSTPQPPKSDKAHLLPTEGTQRGNTTGVAENLCHLLANHIERYRDGARPAITARWQRDMRLLFERGPNGRATPEPIDPERVERAIETVFTELAEPDGRGFCWAAQIRSPNALRDHWDQMADAARRARRAPTRHRNGDPLAGRHERSLDDLLGAAAAGER